MPRRLVSPYHPSAETQMVSALLEEFGLEDPQRTALWDGEHFHADTSCGRVSRPRRSEERTLAEIFTQSCSYCWDPSSSDQVLIAVLAQVAWSLCRIEDLSSPALTWQQVLDLLDAGTMLRITLRRPRNAPSELLQQKGAAAHGRVVQTLRRPENTRTVLDQILAHEAIPDLSAPNAALVFGPLQDRLATAAVLIWETAHAQKKTLVEAPSAVVSFLAHGGCSPLDVSGMTPSQKDTLVSLWDPRSYGPLSDVTSAVDVARSV